MAGCLRSLQVFYWYITGQVKRCHDCDILFALDYFDITTGLCKECHRKQESKIYRLCQMNARLNLTPNDIK